MNNREHIISEIDKLAKTADLLDEKELAISLLYICGIASMPDADQILSDAVTSMTENMKRFIDEKGSDR